MEISDFNAQEQAAPFERAEIARDLFTGAGSVAMPGSPTNEGYLIGHENNQVQGIGPLAGLPDDFYAGAISEPVGLMTDAMAGLLPNPITPFPDVVPGYTVSGYDSQAGITTGRVEAQPSIASDGRLQAGIGANDAFNNPNNANTPEFTNE